MLTDRQVAFLKRCINERDPNTLKQLIADEVLQMETAAVVLVRNEHRVENIRARYKALENKRVLTNT